jgi:hypothetical protein
MDIADLFLEIYDERCDVNITELADLRVAPLHASTATFDTAVRTGDYPRPSTDEPEQLLAIMLGLHRALIYADPDRDVPDKRGMAGYAARNDATHMLTEDTSNGTLVFTRAIAGRPDAADDADRHENLVPGLLRVKTSILLKIDFQVAPALLDLRVSNSRAPG